MELLSVGASSLCYEACQSLNITSLAAASGPEADYQSRTVTLVFSPSVSTFTVPITIIDDLYLENDEPFSAMITLSTVEPGITLDPDTAQITILNDDSKSHCHIIACVYFCYGFISVQQQ